MARRRGLFRLAYGLVLLAFFSLSCGIVEQINEIRQAATDVNALATDIDLQGAMTQVDMSARLTEINLSARLTQIDFQARLTEMNVQGWPTNSDFWNWATQAAQRTPLPTMPGLPPVNLPPTPVGFAPDVPLMPDGRDLGGNPSFAVYRTPSSLQQAVTFYRSAMPMQGWIEFAGNTVGASTAELAFQKGNRIARISINAAALGGTEIQIVIEAF